MRMRNPKDKDEVLNNCKIYLNENLFGNNNPIHMEIGMGKGDFILNMALLNPNINFIGIEKYSSVASIAIKKIEAAEVPNVRVLIIDAANMPEYLFNKVSTLYLNFSDPWPKDRHAKRRLTHENYLKVFDNIFTKENDIILKTDNDNFYAFSRESMLNYGYKIINESLDLHSENIPNVETEYEKKFSEKGIKIKYIHVQK